MKERVKLSAFAKSQGITYNSAWKMWEQGMIDGIKLESGTILVSGWARSITDDPRVVIYTRVNDPKKADDLNRQISVAQSYCDEHNYSVVDVVKEVTQGANYNRPKLLEILKRDNWDIIVVEDERIISSLNFELLNFALGPDRVIEPVLPVTVDREAVMKLFSKVLMYLKMDLGRGAQKKQIIDLMQEINY